MSDHEVERAIERHNSVSRKFFAIEAPRDFPLRVYGPRILAILRERDKPTCATVLRDEMKRVHDLDGEVVANIVRDLFAIRLISFRREGWEAVASD